MRRLLSVLIPACALLSAAAALACVPPGAQVMSFWSYPVGGTVIGVCPSGDWSGYEIWMADMCGNPMAGFDVTMTFGDARVCAAPITSYTDEYGYAHLTVNAGLNSSVSTARVASTYSVTTRGLTVDYGTVSLVSPDYDCSQKVDALDFSFMSLDWPPAAYAARSDLNNDGAVDALDFSVFAPHWTHSY